MGKIAATIQGEDIVVSPDGSIAFTTHASIDADGADGNPDRDPDWQPTTALKHPDGTSLDAYTERYASIPPAVIRAVPGVVLGCLGVALYRGRWASFVAGDVGPADKLGEISPALAVELGVNPSPTTGGEDAHVVHFVLFPGIPAPGFQLQPSRA